jgi:hypothetical protein
MTKCVGFRILVGADLLPSTGFKMNFLVKYQSWVDNEDKVFESTPHIFK